jgi:hypothetical protein
MRIFIGVTALAALVAIGGCKSEATRLADAKKEVGNSCRANALPGIDMDRYCTCVVDKSIGSKSMAEMEKMNEEQGKAMGMQAAAECLAQQSAATGPAAAPSSEAPTDAAKESGEAVEEAVDEAN